MLYVVSEEDPLFARRFVSYLGDKVYKRGFVGDAYTRMDPGGVGQIGKQHGTGTEVLRVWREDTNRWVKLQEFDSEWKHGVRGSRATLRFYGENERLLVTYVGQIARSESPQFRLYCYETSDQLDF